MKSSLLGLLYVLLAMLTTVHSLVCEICLSTDVTWCTGSSVICPFGQVCGSQFSTTTIGEETHTTFVRSCVQPAECFLKGSVTFNKGSMKMCTSCCNTNNCFATLPDFPEDSTEANGVICRTCATLASTWCYTSDIMHCTGLETKCLRQSVEVEVFPVFWRFVVAPPRLSVIWDIRLQAPMDKLSPSRAFAPAEAARCAIL
uniref:Sodefrin-like factor n=1 Tax=Leptobrachium leishanense TaxID=445787 RepID=A0A8C5QQL8_9ANUR